MIGAGPFNRHNHAPALQRLAAGSAPAVALDAVCDLDLDKAKRYAQDFGFRAAFGDLHEMIRSARPDAVYVLVPPAAAADVLCQVLPYGLPTFTEKPPGVTVEQAERVADLAAAHGQITYVAFNRRRTPALVKLKAWAAEHGPPRYVHATMLRTKRREEVFATGTAIHPLDALRYLAGDVAHIRTEAQPYPGAVCRDFRVRLDFVSGLTADLHVIVDSGVQLERYVVYTEGQTAEATVPGAYSSAHFCPGFRVHAGREVVEDCRAVDDPLVACGFLGEHEAFLRAIEQGESPDCSLQDARHSVRLALAVHEEYTGPLPGRA